MNRLRWLSPLLALGLVACPPAAPKPPAPSLTPDRAYGPEIPVGAVTLTPEEFQRRLDADELTLTSANDAETRRETSRARLAADLAALSALPDKSEALQALLTETPDALPTPNGDLLIRPLDNNGQPFDILTLGQGTVARGLLEARRAAEDPQNALTVYGAAYGPLSQDQKAGLPAPETLAGKPLADVKAALAALEEVLGDAADLDLVRPGAEGEVDPQAAIGPGGPGAGNGTDNDGPCPVPSADGLRKRLRWPLEPYLGAVKQQGGRGTCWAFASVGALHSAEQVVNGRNVNLSEQHFNNQRKLNTNDSEEGDWPREALNDLAGRGTVAYESAWTYNPSSNRTKKADGTDDGQRGVCNEYSGLCSENVHQNPVSCTSFLGLNFCGNDRVTYSSASSLPASRASVVWENTSGAALPLNTIRGLLNNGQVLILSFEVRPGFSNPRGGYITSTTAQRRGSHAVQLVGYIPDALADGAPAVDGGGTGGGWFVVKNSWGCPWGDAGYAYMPVRYVRVNGACQGSCVRG